MNEARFTLLLDQYVTGYIQEPEQREFFALLENPAYQQLLEKKLENEWHQGLYEEKEHEQIGRLIEQYVLNKIGNEQPVVTMPRGRTVRAWRAVAAAAVLVILAGAGYYLWQNNQKNNPPIPTLVNTKDARPGGNKAVLVLGNGKRVILDSLQNGLIAQQGAAAVNKLENGKLSYRQDSKGKGMVFNTVSTPRGGQYQIQLEDGTWVWLNAASSLRFPTAFTGNTRTVEITGEAYFEVARDPARPFKVIIAPQPGGKRAAEIEVLGTHFNVHAYDNEALLKTTLVEGKVKVTTQKDARLTADFSRMLSPGQQAQIGSSNQLTVVNDIDMEEVLAWKNGLFRFNNADIETVMKQVERWYDVEVVYEGPKPDGHYRGKVPRDVMASEMLKIIEASGVRCRIENKKVIIMQ